MAEFPKLEPAFTACLYPADKFSVGSSSMGSTLDVVTLSHGSFVSEPGFPIQLDATVAYGSDYVRLERSQTHARFNVKSILKNKNNALISYSYKGILEVDPEFQLIFTNDPNAKTTSYGKAISHITFETGSDLFKELEHSLFVGSAHLVVTENGYHVETKISRVIG